MGVYFLAFSFLVFSFWPPSRFILSATWELDFFSFSEERKEENRKRDRGRERTCLLACFPRRISRRAPILLVTQLGMKSSSLFTQQKMKKKK